MRTGPKHGKNENTHVKQNDMSQGKGGGVTTTQTFSPSIPLENDPFSTEVHLLPESNSNMMSFAGLGFPINGD